MIAECAKSTLTIRHYRQGDYLPPNLYPGMELCINPHWAWVGADANDSVKIILLAAPVHGIVMLLRLWAAEDAPRLAIRNMLREVARECSEIGMVGWMTMLGADQQKELKLAKIALRYGGTGAGFVGFLYAGRLESVLCQQQR